MSVIRTLAASCNSYSSRGNWRRKCFCSSRIVRTSLQVTSISGSQEESMTTISQSSISGFADPMRPVFKVQNRGSVLCIVLALPVVFHVSDCFTSSVSVLSSIKTGCVTGRLLLAVTGVRTGSLAILVVDVSMLFINPSTECPAATHPIIKWYITVVVLCCAADTVRT